jgi:hypothetical protein
VELEEAGGRAAGDEHGVLEHVGEELFVVDDAEQDGVAEGADEAAAGLVAVAAAGDHLGDHRVVVGRDLLAGAHAVVDAHAGAGGGQPGVDGAGLREVAGVGVLGVEADLDRVAGAG